jgi:SAM-dependent methyltransferase
MNNDSNASEKKGFSEGFWSNEKLREMFLEEQRQYIWNKDYWKNVLVPLFKLKEDSVIADIGCGLGFLGRMLAEFVPNGKIIGVDLDAKLVEGAKKMSELNNQSKLFDFRVGNTYGLPIESNIAGLSICQTLLMHLEEPMRAIVEMQRVTRKGGRVVAIESDMRGVFFLDTAFESIGYSLEQKEKFWRWERILSIGKANLGRGDNEIGSKVPYLFYKSGLRIISVRCQDRTSWLIPPYQNPSNDLELKHFMMSPQALVEMLDMRTEFLKGGGTEAEWKEYLDLVQKEHEIRLQQIKEKTFVTVAQVPMIATIAEKI